MTERVTPWAGRYWNEEVRTGEHRGPVRGPRCYSG